MLLHIRNWVITCLECSHVVICVAFGANKSIYVNCKSQCSPFGVFKACFSCLRGSMSHYIVLHNIGIIWKETLCTRYPCATLLAGLHKPFFVLVWTEQKQGFFSVNVKCQMLLFLFCFCPLCKKNEIHTSVFTLLGNQSREGITFSIMFQVSPAGCFDFLSSMSSFSCDSTFKPKPMSVVSYLSPTMNTEHSCFHF